MKRVQNYLKVSSAAILLFIVGLLTSVNTWAQDRDINYNVTVEGDNVAWYNLWWVWAVGLALFVIIIVAIVSAGKKT
jgi:uncharacterized membrane protein YidH (DUF202 family)